MQSVHPEFDPDTRTWFAPGLKPEAASLRALYELLGGATAVEIIGWRPISTAIAVDKPPLTADRVLADSAAAKQTARVRKHMAEARRRVAAAAEVAIAPPPPVAALPVPEVLTIEAPPIALKAEYVRQRYETQELARAALLARKKAYRQRRKVRTWAENEARLATQMAADAKRKAEAVALLEVAAAIARRNEHYATWPPKSHRTEVWFRSRCSDMQNAALDMWAKGISGPVIARALGVTTAFVGAHTVTRARLRGDPRAVIRDPINYGKTKRQPRQRRRRDAQAVGNKSILNTAADV